MTKVRYDLDLSALDPAPHLERVRLRVVSTDDLEALADLMLDAYMGTIDYDGESYEDALTEVTRYLAGSPMLEYSYAVELDGKIISAILMSLIEERPFISYVMTRAAHKNTGLASFVIWWALAELAESGQERVSLYITEGNAASEALFRSFGAVAVPHSS